MTACRQLHDIGRGRFRNTGISLSAGGTIGAHRDPAYGWQSEIVRLHVPVVTHPDVTFFLERSSLHLEPGELWYLDTSREHEVHNRSPLDRVHLVFDLLNTDEIRAQLDSIGTEWCLWGARGLGG